jgi:hypothetical protein
MQAARIDELFGKASGTYVLAGDLNARPGSAPVRALMKNWVFATEPGGRGLLTIPLGVRGNRSTTCCSGPREPSRYERRR